MKTTEDMRELVADCKHVHGEKLERFRAIGSGPYWPVLRRYARLVEGAEELVKYIDELTEIIEEQDHEKR